MKKTQAFMVMGFIIALVLAIGFYMQKEDERNMRIKVEEMLSSLINEKNLSEIKLNKKIQDKERFIAHLSASLSKEEMINSRLAQNLERSAKRFAVSSHNKKPIELEKIIVSSLLEVEGRILAVDKQNDLVVVNLGAINNLKNGDRLSIYRGDSFIANAELVKVQNRISAAMVLPGTSSKDLKVEVNDMVK
ncbi:MAG: hypothetical protein Q8N76_08320 [Candidatus Omnitrophota bacterium]|nr:hypothetical protein [Candidatus Omnitrophota bacterium]